MSCLNKGMWCESVECSVRLAAGDDAVDGEDSDIVDEYGVEEGALSESS